MSEPTVSFGVLGPVEVRVDGRVVAAPRGKRRLLLAALLASWERPVLVDQLVDLLWGDDPPANARRNLDAETTRLRGALAELPGDVRIDREGQLLALVPGSATLDRVAFEAALAEARRGREAGDHQRVALAAERGLDRWRGPAFGDLADRGLLHAHAVRLDEERWVLVELRAHALLQLGRLAELVGELHAAVAESPLREELRRLLMVALARSGRHAEALRVYEDHRRLLADELGLEPSAALRRLERQVLDHDPLLLADAGATPAPGEQWPLPPELTVLPPVSVGRAGALDALRQAVATVTGGRRGLVVLRGEAGAGKSHVVAAAARDAHDAGALVLAGACEADVRPPLGPIVRALRFYREHAGAAGDDVLAPWWPELGRLLPEVAREVAPDGGLDAGSERARLFDAVAGWLSAVAERRPVVLVLEDLHWADATTLLLVKHLMASPSVRRVLVVATARDPEPDGAGAVDDLVGATRREGVLLAEVELGGLTGDEVAQLVAELRPDLARDRDVLAGALVERTGGNALFVVELVHDIPLRRRGERADLDDVVRRLGSPPSATHLVAARLHHLDDEARRILTDAALIGDDVSFDLVVEVTRTSPEDVLRALDGPIDVGLLRHLPDDTGGRLRFSHAVVRDALVDRLRPAERIEGHRRITGAILGLPDHRRRSLVEELARHAAESSMVDGPLPAVPHVLRAGRQALDRRAYDHAARWFARGLAFADEAGVPDGPDPARHEGAAVTRFDVLCALGGAQRRAGDPAFRDAILAAARLAQDAGDAAGVAEAALAGTRGFFRQTAVPDEEWLALLEVAVASSEASPPATRASLLASLASELVWADPDGRRFRLSDEALALARQVGAPALLSQVLFLRMVTIWAPDTDEERLAIADEAMALAEQAGDRTVRCHVLRFGAASAIALGRREVADGYFDECQRLTTEIDQPDLAWHHALSRSGWLLWSGDVAGAEEQAMAAIRLGDRAGQPESFTFGSALLLEIARLRGTARPMVEIGLTRAPVDPAFGFQRHVAAAGYDDEARAILRDAVAGLDRLGRGVHTLPALANLADIAHRLDDADAAAALHPHLVPWADRVPQAIVIQPTVHHALGLLAVTLDRPDAVDRHLGDAVAAHRRLAAPLHEAESLLAWGRATGDDARLAAGRELADSLGAPGLVA
jgi:DNA-binding SARP family transcriptional activator